MIVLLIGLALLVIPAVYFFDPHVAPHVWQLMGMVWMCIWFWWNTK